MSGGEATASPLVVMAIDEPDAALHLTAQRHTVAGLRQLATDLDTATFVSTHSREFLDHPGVVPLHVSRGLDGLAVVDPLKPIHREMCESLALPQRTYFSLAGAFSR